MLLIAAAVVNVNASIHYDTPMKYKLCMGDTIIIDKVRVVNDTIWYDTIVSSTPPDVQDTLIRTTVVNQFPTFLKLETERRIERGTTFNWHGIVISKAGMYEKVYKSIHECDSIYQIQVRERVETHITDTLCLGSSMTFGNQTLTKPGIYRDSLHYADYDSITILSLLGHMPDTVTHDVRIPEGTSFDWNGNSYSQTGVYDLLFTDRFGCDSLSRLVLTVYHVDTIDTAVVVCPGESYTWHGYTGSQTMKYEFPGVRENGDQVWYRFDLTVKPMVVVDTTFTICDDETLSFNGKVYTNPGEYADQYTCDTLYKITVVKHPTKLHVQTAVLDRTNPYYWRYVLDGVQYVDTILAAGTYEHTTHDVETGCNEIYRLIVTKDETAYHYITDTVVCENEYFEWRGKTGLNRQGIGTTTHYYDRYRTAADQDSIYELILRVQPVPRTSQTIKFCGSIEWNGVTYTESTVLVDTIMSMQYHCDSIVTTLLSKGIPFHKHDTATIRLGESITWRGQIISTDGQYKDSYVTAAGCDSIYSLGVGLEEVPVATPTRTWYASICEGDYYLWEADNQKYFNGGTYVDTVFNAANPQQVDSLHILIITKNQKYVTRERITSHVFPTYYRGQEFYRDQEVEFHYTSVNGCDSVVIVKAEFEISHFEENVVICPGESYIWDWDGLTYRETGRYFKTVKDQNGNDSVEHILNLTVKYIPDTYIKKTICKGSSYTYGDRTLTEAGIYDFTFHETGCDSIVHLALNVVSPDTIRYVHHMDEHDSYTWHGETYHETGVHYFHGTNRWGCDSLEILQLTVNHVDTIDSIAVICPNEIPFVWHGITASQSGKFTGTEEISGVINYYRLDLTVREMVYLDTTFTICGDQTVTFHGVTYNESGTYPNHIACDTIVNVHIVNHPQQVYETHARMTDDHGYHWTYWDNGVKHENVLFNQPGTYEFETPNAETGCSEIWRLILTLDENSYLFQEALTICEGDDFTWQGLSGLSSITGTNTYRVEYETHAGKDSIYELTLTVVPVERTVRTITFCGETEWKGKTYTSSTVVYDTISLANGCYRIERINLDKAQSYYFRESKDWPQGKVLIWHGQNITTDGVYYDRLTTVQGCDSVYELTVTIIPAAPESNQYAEELSTCEGDTIVWRGKNIWRSGTYVDTVWAEGKVKVDSIFTLSFIAWPAPKDTIYEHLYTCNDGGVIRYNGKDYLKNDTVITNYHTIHGCDSVVKTYLHFNEALFLRDTARVAENTLPYAWTPTGTDTTIYLMEPSTYQYKQKTNGGCENVWELFFEVYPVFILRDSVAVCESELPYHWERGPIEYRSTDLSAEPGTTREVSYSFTSTITGTDSVYILKLTVLPQIKKIEQHYFCEGEDVSIYGKTYYMSSSDSVLHDTIMRPNPEVAGCDSIIYLEIYQNPVNRVTETVIMHIGDTINWRSMTITELLTKTYEERVINSTGCEDVYQLRVIAEQRTIATGCESMLPYTDWRYPVETAGLHTDTLRENGFITGFYTLDLRIDTVPTRTIREYVCAGTPRTINNKVYGADPAQYAQMFRDTILDWPSATSACDSTIFYEIYVSGPTEQTETKVIRDGDTIVWEGDTITEIVTKTYKHITNDPVTNCEITHYLNVIAEDRLVINDFCALDTPYVWSYNNEKYYTTGVYTDTTFENGFITRFYTLDLTVKNPEEKTIFLEGCIEKGGVTFLDQVYLNDTIVSDTLDCDTIYTIHVTIHRVDTVYLNDTICENDLPYILGRQNPDTIWTEDANPYYHSDTTAYGCDSTVVLTLHITPTLGKNDSTFICEDEIAEHPVVLGNLTNPWFDTSEGGKYHGKWEGKWTGVKYTTDTIVWDCNHEYFHHIIVRPRQKLIPEVEYSICKGDSVQPFWPHNPIWVKTDTVIYDTIPNINPFEDIKHGGIVHNDRAYVCDSITKWTFHLADTVHNHLYKHIREGETYVFNDSILATTGVYDSISDHTTMDSAHNFCKAYYHLHLTVDPIYRTTDTIDICFRANREYTYVMRSQDDSTYTFKFQTPDKDTALLHFEDSLMHPSYQHYDHYFNLVVYYRQEYFTQLYDTICEGDSLRFDIHHHNNTLDQRFLKVKGIYYDTIPALNGCDSIIELYFETRDSIQTTYLEKTVSDRELPYIWTNSWYEENVRQDSTMELRETGIYQITMPTLHGCDSTIVLNFTVHQTHVFRDTITVCAPVNRTLSHIWDFEPNYEQFFTVPDHDVDTTYEDTLVTRIINDSIYHLYVHYHVEDSTIINATICEGDSLRFGLSRLNMPRFLKTPGTYRDTLVRHDNSCDSIIVLRLNVYPRYLNDSTKHIADVDTPFVWIHKLDGQEIARDSLYAAGRYGYRHESSFGCDSIDSLTLVIHPTYLFKDTVTICYDQTPYTWYNADQTEIFQEGIYETGTYIKRLQTHDLYDSTYVRYVRVIPVIHDTIRHAMCEGTDYLFNGVRYTEGGTYTDTLVSNYGCDSIVTLILTVNKSVYVRIPADIYEGETYMFYGQPYTTSGTYRHYSLTPEGCDSIAELFLTVHPQIDTIVTICKSELPYTWVHKWSGQERLLYSPGIYRDDTTVVNDQRTFYTLQLIVNEPLHDTIRHAMCEGASYEFKGNTYTEAGIYRDTLRAANGCDSIVTLILTVNKPYYNIIRETILEGNSVEFFGTTYTTSGTYTHYARTPEGCDSTTVLQLTVHPLVDTIITVCDNDLPVIWNNRWNGKQESYYTSGLYRNDTTINGEKMFYGIQVNVSKQVFDTIRHAMCEGASYEFKGNTYTEAGIYRDTLRATNGCDSIVTLILTVNKPYYNIIRETILEGQYYVFFGDTIRETKAVTHSTRTPEGCDSTTILELTVHQLVDTVITVCSYELPYVWTNKWNGLTETFYKEGTYRNDTSMNGEHYFYGVKLEVRQPSDTTIYREICEGSSYSFNGRDLTVGGEYRDTLINTIGCDSVIILHLNVLKTYHNVVYHSIFEGDSVEFLGNYYKTAGNYPFHFTSSFGCDSIIELQLTVNRLFDDSISICANDLPYVWKGKTIYESGIYRDTVINTQGKETVIGLKVTVLPIVHAPEPIVATICEGDFYKFGDTILTTQGTYYDTLVAVNGCDSIVMLALQVMPTKHQIDNKTIFEGDTVMFYGDTLTTSGIYTHNDTTANGCANTHQLVLTVLKEARMDTTAYVCENKLPFIWHGYEFNQSGDYEVPTAWTDSSRVVTTLHLIVREAPYKEVHVNMCYGNTFIVNNDVITESGTYDYTIKSQLGCDSLIRYIVTVHHTFERWDTAHISDKQSYDFPADDGSTRHLTIPGDYEYTGKTALTECDSIIHLHLVVHPSYYFKDSIEICKSDANYPYVWKDGHDSVITTIYETGTYFNKHLTARYGFDSIYELRVAVYDSYLIEEKYEIGVDEHLDIHGQDISKPGIYYDSLLSSHGCDSIYKIVVNPKRVKEFTWTKEICQGEYFEFPDGTKFTQTGNYKYVSAAKDSIIYLSLNVISVSYTEERIVIAKASLQPCGGTDPNCYSYLNPKNGKLYNDLHVGYNIFEERSASGTKCDNILRTIIIVTEHYNRTWDQLPLCPGSQIEINGTVITQPGSYQIECLSDLTGEMDSLYRVKVYLAKSYDMPAVDVTICQNELPYTFAGETLRRAGSYTFTKETKEGCDSIVRINLSVNPTYHEYTDVTIPDYEKYQWKDGVEYNQTGEYDYVLPTINSCDSTNTLRLTVIPTQRYTSADTICEGQEYTWRGHTYRESGYFTDTVYRPESFFSAIYTLQLTVLSPTFVNNATATDFCADDKEFSVSFSYSGAKPTMYSIYFDAQAKSVGFQDIINKPLLGEDKIATIPVPQKSDTLPMGQNNYIKPNWYTMSLVFDNGACAPSSADNIKFCVKYPSWVIEQNWDDVVAPLNKTNNGRYEFSQVEWNITRTIGGYTDVISIPNNGQGYLHYDDLRVGDEVFMIATRKGENYSIPSCPIVIQPYASSTGNEPTLVDPIYVYPKMAPRHAPKITIEAPNGCDYTIYSSMGSFISGGSMEAGKQEVTLPNTNGIYFIRTVQGKEDTTHKVVLY